MSEIYREDIAGVDLSEPLSRESVGKTFATGDKLANRIGVRVRRSGKPVDLTGHAVMGYFIRPDRKTVVMEGQTVGNTAYVDVAQACLTERGTFSLAIKVSGDDVTQTLRVLDGSIILTQTDALIDPGDVIPTLDDIFAQIAAMEAAADNANAAAEYANQAASSALNTTLYLMGAASPVIIQSASGDGIVPVSDSAERSLSGLSVYGKTTQDGTPTPEAPVELVNAGNSGSITVKVCGRNIAHKATVKQYPANSTPDIIAPYTGKITLSAKPLSGSQIVNYCIRQNGQMTHTNWIKSTDGNGVWYNKVLDVSDFTGAWVYETADGARTWEDVILSIGEVQMTDELYATLPQPQSMTASTPNGLPGIPVSSGGNYIDSTGQQWVCDEIDLTRKVYVKRIGVLTFDGQNYPATAASSAPGVFFIDIAQTGYKMAYGVNNAYCSNYVFDGVAQSATAVTKENTFRIYRNADTNALLSSIYFRNSNYATLDNFKAALSASPVTVAFPIRAVIETPLSPEELTGSTSLTAQYPNTTAFNDAGAGMKMEYIADTKIYIDQRIAALMNA